MVTIPDAPGAAKFLLNWPTTDVNITTRSGESFRTRVCSTITANSDQLTIIANPDQVPHQFLLQQWNEIEIEIEEMLLERGP
jgi:hypothetical protein